MHRATLMFSTLMIFSASVAADPLTGQQLLEGLRMIDQLTTEGAEQPSADQWIQISRAMGNVDGVIATAEIANVACPPKGYATGESYAIVRQSLESRPDQWHRLGSFLAAEAFMSAWPCSGVLEDPAKVTPE